jgi:photosynthetic reaction center cytochrome c subunit
VEAVQDGFRGTGMDQVINPRSDVVRAAKNVVPEALPAASGEGPLASVVYQNVQVLNDLSVGQFTRVMLAMTQWVAPPDQACNYCHGGNMASDDKYTKVVARRMLQMVRHINSDWKNHVGLTGVTCYTCHRGNAVPQYVWFENPGESKARGLSARNDNLFSSVGTAAVSSLPYDPFTAYLLGSEDIRVNGDAALPVRGQNASLQRTELTYSLMMHMSSGLGVNCDYCHNTRSLSQWNTSTPQRATAWYGIRMARNLNNEYLVPLTPVFPVHRLGLKGDVAKVNCQTCHQGVFKPLYGESMLKDYPELAGSHTAAVVPASPPPVASLGPVTTGAAAN